MEALDLSGKVAIITGSSSGIGAATAKLMGRRGAKVTIHGRDPDKLAKVKEECVKAGVKVDDILSVSGDITDVSVRQKLVSETVKGFGRIDILVNNAGNTEHNNMFLNMTQENLTKSFEILLYAPVFLSQLCHPYLVKTKGNIINISSVVADQVAMASFTYSCAKISLDTFTKYAAVEFGKDGIRVNSIRPGTVVTDINRVIPQQIMPTIMEGLASQSILGYNAECDQLAEVIAFYASDAANFITGDINKSDGGLTVARIKPPVLKLPVDMNNL